MNALDRVRETWPDEVRDHVRRFSAGTSLREVDVLKHWHPEYVEQYEVALKFFRAELRSRPRKRFKPTAEQRMKWRAMWAEHVAAFPEECSFCRRSFKTERGLRQHQRLCMSNPVCKRYVSGEYVPVIRGSRIVGFCLNTPEARESFQQVDALLGTHATLPRALQVVKASDDKATAERPRSSDVGASSA